MVHVPTVEALIGSVVTVLTNTVGRVELLSWLKPLVSHLPAGEVRQYMYSLVDNGSQTNILQEKGSCDWFD